MARELKQMIVKELTGRYDRLDRCVVVDLTGLKATALGQIRAELKKQDITLSVVKNSLAMQAFSQMGLEQLGVLLKGPSALAVGDKDALSLVKTMMVCATKNKIKVRGALAEGQIFEQAQMARLARVPDKKVLQAQFLATMKAPVSGMVGVMSAVVRKFVGTMDAVRQQSEKSQG